jgi:replicative DNA helicase
VAREVTDGALVALSAEKELLGCMMIDPIGVEDAFLSVGVEDWFSEKHRRIASGIRDLMAEGLDVTPVTLIEHLRGRGDLDRAGTLPYIMGLGDTVSSTVYADSSAALVLDRARRRRLVTFAQETVRRAKDAELPLDEVYGAVERSLGQARGTRDRPLLDDYADEALAVLDHTLSTYWQSGLPALDRLSGGFKGLTILAARPSMGKSSLMRDILRFNAERAPVALFTNDQAGSDVLSFEASRRSRVPFHEIKTWAAVPTSQKRWRDALIAVRDEFRESYLIDHRPHNIDALASHIRSAARWGAQLIAVDYLQNVPVPGQSADNLVRSVGLVSQTLKLLTQELSVPILALAQLNRGVENRKDKRPIMSDLRESGQIEQDAEAILFMFREEYYLSRDQGRREDVESWCEIIVAKNKTGPTGTARLIFDSHLATFRADGGIP